MIVKIGIYRIINPLGKIYVGQSKDILDRFKQYKRYSCKKQIKLYNSLVYYGSKNHSFENIDEYTDITIKEQLDILYEKTNV